MVSDYSQFELGNLIEGLLDSYQREREQEWQAKGPDERIHFDRSESFGVHIYECCQKLFSTGKMDDDIKPLQYELEKLYGHVRGDQRKEFGKKLEEIKNLDLDEQKKAQEGLEACEEYIWDIPEDPCEKDSPLRLVWERLCIHYLSTLPGVEICSSRTIQLFELILDKKPSSGTMFYLSKLSRCYLYGFDAECVILCRCVLEAAINSRITYDDCEKYLGQRKYNQDFSLKDKIVVAKMMKYIDEKIEKTADMIRIRGNNAIHKHAPAGNVLEIIKATIDVISAFETRKE